MTRHNAHLYFLAVGLICFTAANVGGTEPVFPGAVGFGTETRAGRGGRILRVTNLNAKGPGSLRAAVEAKGARVVVFEVGGVIDLGRNGISITEPFSTVAGLDLKGHILDSQDEVGGYPRYRITHRPLNIPKHDVQSWLNEMAAQVE